MTTPQRTTRKRTAAVLGFAVGLGVLGAGIQSRFLADGAPASVTRHYPFVLLVVAFAVAESLVVHLEFRREVHSISMSELALVLGLVLYRPGVLLPARLIGAGLALLVHRRQLGVKLVFNLGNFALETAMAAAIYRGLLAGHSPFSALGVLAAFAAVIAANLLGGFSVVAAISLFEGRMRPEMLVQVLGAQVAAALANTTLALVGVVVIVREPYASWLLVAICAFAFVGFRSHTALRQRYAGLELLYGFTKSVGGSTQTEEVLTVLLTQAADLLRAEVSQIMLLGEDGTQATLSALGIDGKLVSTVVSLDGDTSLELRAVQTQAAVLAPRSTNDEDLARRLAVRSRKDAVVIPLRREGVVVGTFLVADRLGHVSTFDLEDVKLFETIAAHASASLENGHLIDRLRHEAARNEHQSLHDSLTGLPNRSLFHREVTAVLRSNPQCAAVMLMDLDRFKEINDTLGHHIGDGLLVEISTRLRNIVAEHGHVARLGGDEFAILLPHVTDAVDAETIARLILASLERPFAVGDLALEIGASIGVAMYPAHAEDSSSLLQRADVAMYEAKTNHRGHAVYEAERDRSNARRLSLAAEMRAAIERGDMTVAYQPKADLGSGRVSGVEALVRWVHPRYGSLPPDEFIPVAEHTGLIGPLTDFVLAKALAQCKEWLDLGFEISVAVNLSARSLVDLDLADDIADHLARAGVDARLLTLEITEATIMADPIRALEILHQLAAMGVTLSIDDFGTGYSSLSHLKRLPVHEVKIDKSFVATMTVDEDDATIVRSVVDLARNLRLHVVAEGVEDSPSLSALADLGCDSVQGYFLSKPLSADTLTKSLLDKGTELSAWVKTWKGTATQAETEEDVQGHPLRLVREAGADS